LREDYGLKVVGIETGRANGEIRNREKGRGWLV
jgi:hypothetical protein